MPVRSIDRSDLERFEGALRDAGYRVLKRDGEAPWRYLLRDRRGERKLRLILYMWPLRGSLLRPAHMRVGLHRRRGVGFECEPGALTLLLGYQRELDVYAGWPVERYRGARPRASAWVSRALLDEARETGIAPAGDPAARGSWESPAVAFARGRIRDYLELVQTPGRSQPIVFHGAQRVELERPPPRARRDACDIDDLVESAGVDDLFSEQAVYRGSAPPAPPLVETGFATIGAPDEPLAAGPPLDPQRIYYFWFGVGADMGRSIERTPAPLPDLPAGTRLIVCLFGFPKELELVGPAWGEIELGADGRSRVVRHAAHISEEMEIDGGALYFVVRTPAVEGRHRLRCNVYLGSTLVQSRLVSCRVGGVEDPGAPALDSTLVDYALGEELTPPALARLPAHDLSLMVNGAGGGGSHQFRFFSADGEEPFASDASLGAPVVELAIERARGALRQASWGTREEWSGDVGAYRYATSPHSHFVEDLIELARCGRALYAGIALALAGGYDPRKELERRSRKPGRIQIATAAAGLYVPAGLFYDHQLEHLPGEAHRHDYRLCEVFASALDGTAPLEELPCFAMGCPSAEDPYVVCPSGFWGYRHEIGWPVSGTDPLQELPCDGRAQLAIGVSTDPALTLREAHAKRILGLGEGSIVSRRAELTALLREAPHLVYLYCHGGLVAGSRAPFVEIGVPGEDDAIDRVYLQNEGIRWEGRRPVVFINGCHTTALEPREVLDLVGGFVEEANAVGVVGTELTIFEPLVCAFAETMLAAFLSGSAAIGTAVRGARLALLKDRNPLGLVYVPFIAAATRLAPPPASPPPAAGAAARA